MTSHYITTHNANGKGCFSTTTPEEAHNIPYGPDPSKDPSGLQMVYSSHTLTPDLSTEADLQRFSKDRTEGLPAGQVCPPQGIAAGIFTQGPNSESMWHRTMTVDMIYIIEGAAEMQLDSGEVKVLKAGDTIVQRGTMHKWKNVTPNGGLVKTFGVAIPCQGQIEVGGKKLDVDWRAVGEDL